MHSLNRTFAKNFKMPRKARIHSTTGMDQLDLSHLTILVKQPLESDGCAGLEEDAHLSDNDVRQMLFEMLQGVHSLEAIANLPKKDRDKIVILALQRGAGIRQLERITGIGFSMIRRLKMKNVSKTPSPLCCNPNNWIVF